MRCISQDFFRLTFHAQQRLAQRGIRAQALDLVLMHGSRRKAGRGCETYALTRETLAQLSHVGGDSDQLRAAAKIRAVVNEAGEVVTCYHASDQVSAAGMGAPGKYDRSLRRFRR